MRAGEGVLREQPRCYAVRGNAMVHVKNARRRRTDMPLDIRRWRWFWRRDALRRLVEAIGSGACDATGDSDTGDGTGDGTGECGAMRQVQSAVAEMMTSEGASWCVT